MTVKLWNSNFVLFEKITPHVPSDLIIILFKFHNMFEYYIQLLYFIVETKQEIIKIF